MKLSIIVPVYNSSEYLERCLSSVVSAIGDKSDVEVLVLDDGSTDNSFEIICKFYQKQSYFLIYRDSRNWGVSYTRNKGLQNCHGDWVTFLDADDEMCLDAVYIMLEAIENHNDMNIIEFNHDRYYAKFGKRVTKYTNKEQKYNCIKSLFKLQKWQMVWNKLYREEFLVKHGVMFESPLQFGEDELFNLECIKADPYIYHVNRSIVIKHFDNIHSLSKSVTDKQLIAQNDVLCELLMFSEDPEFRNLVRQIIADHWNSKLYRRIFKQRLGEAIED